jgi:hypothetical protein
LRLNIIEIKKEAETIVEETMSQQLLTKAQACGRDLSSVYTGRFFERLFTKTGLRKSSVIRQANISRSYGYQIIDGSRIAKRDYYIAIAIAMNLDLATTQWLLAITETGVLYRPLKRDAAIIFAIQHGYDHWELYELLRALKLPPLDIDR